MDLEAGSGKSRTQSTTITTINWVFETHPFDGVTRHIRPLLSEAQTKTIPHTFPWCIQGVLGNNGLDIRRVIFSHERSCNPDACSTAPSLRVRRPNPAFVSKYQ